MTIFFAHSLILIRQFKGLPLVLRDAVLDTIIARICGICNPFCTIHRLGDSYIRISAALVVRLVPHCHGTVNLACPDAQLLANPFKRAADRLCNLCVMLRDLPRRLHVREKHTHRVIGNNFVGCRLLVKAKVPHVLGDRVKPRPCFPVRFSAAGQMPQTPCTAPATAFAECASAHARG